MSCLLSYAIPTWLKWFLCKTNALWLLDEIFIRLGAWNYTIFTRITIHVQHYDDHVLHKIPNYEIINLWILVMRSKVSSLVSFILSSPGGLVPNNLVVCLEPCHVFTILSDKPRSIELSQSCDSGNIKNLSNLSSSVISVI